jgi:hypothetical protein
MIIVRMVVGKAKKGWPDSHNIVRSFTEVHLSHLVETHS